MTSNDTGLYYSYTQTINDIIGLSGVQFVIILGINEAWAGFVNYEYEYS